MTKDAIAAIVTRAGREGRDKLATLRTLVGRSEPEYMALQANRARLLSGYGCSKAFIAKTIRTPSPGPEGGPRRRAYRQSN